MEHNKLTLYVIEDTFIYQQLIGQLLKPVDACMPYFTSGEKVLDKLPTNAPDLVILDYHLDGAMTGLDTLKWIRRHYPAVYVILFSTCTDINTSENIRLYGAFDFVEKNGDGFRILQQKISQVLGFLKPEA